MKVHTLDIKKVGKLGKAKHITIKENNLKVYLSEQNTGYGVKHFFICPNCSSRREILYLIDNKCLGCRSCLPINIYRGIQNNTKGGEAELQYRMERIGEEYGIEEWEFPFNYMEVLLKRPKYARIKKWEEGVRKLQALENMRFQNIIYGNKYPAKTINHVFSKRLYTYTLIEMKNDFINWYS